MSDTSSFYDRPSEIAAAGPRHGADPRGGFTNVPDAAMTHAGSATTIHGDGSVTTRAKSDGFGTSNPT